MGQLKKIFPVSTRDKIAEFVDDRIPNGFVRNQSANAISAAGAGMVVLGTYIDKAGYKKSGAALRCIGETADDIDGDWARRFNIANSTGALVDATLDKVKVAAEVYALWSHTSDMAKFESQKRKRRIAFVAGKHSLNAALNIYIKAKGGEPSSSSAGKANMWADGLFVGGASIADASESTKTKAVGNALSDIGFVSGVAIGMFASAGYLKQAIDVSKQQTAGENARIINFPMLDPSEMASISGIGLDS